MVCREMASCRLSGSIPLGLYKSTQLKKLCVVAHCICSQEFISVRCRSFEPPEEDESGIAVSNCQTHYSGEIPDSLSSLTRLENLIIRRSAISGTIPAQMASLTAITVNPDIYSTTITGFLQLHENRLSGYVSNAAGPSPCDVSCVEVPSSLSSLSELHILFFSHNSLSGSIPGSFRAMRKVRMYVPHSSEVV